MRLQRDPFQLWRALCMTPFLPNNNVLVGLLCKSRGRKRPHIKTLQLSTSWLTRHQDPTATELFTQKTWLPSKHMPKKRGKNIQFQIGSFFELFTQIHTEPNQTERCISSILFWSLQLGSIRRTFWKVSTGSLKQCLERYAVIFIGTL